MIRSSSEPKWYIFYTCPRAEKVVEQELLKRNYDVFLPKMKTFKVWKNRQKKVVDQVLFPNYIFIKTFPFELYRITQTPKIVSCITCSGEPSIITTKEVEGIKEMLNLSNEIIVESSFIKGENVRIVSGPLIGYEGVLVKQKGKTRFGLQVKNINQTILVDISTSVLEKY